MSDLDILVHEHELKKVEAVLRESGWKMKELNEYDDHYYRSWSQELPPMFHPSTGTTLDIHHNLLPRTSRRHFSADFLHHNIEITEAHNLATLNLEYRLIHCVIHLFCNEEFDKAARDFFDIHALLEKVRAERKFNSLFHEAAKCNCSYEVALSVLIDQQAYCGTYSDDEIRYCNKILGLRGKILKYVAGKAIEANHTIYDSFLKKACRVIMFSRGHLVKMPFSILIPHSLNKMRMWAVTCIMGQQHYD